jgi:hypothetical protein
VERLFKGEAYRLTGSGIAKHKVNPLLYFAPLKITLFVVNGFDRLKTQLMRNMS